MYMQRFRLFIAVFFIKLAVFIINKKTTEGLSLIMYLHKWVDYISNIHNAYNTKIDRNGDNDK